MRRLPSNLKLRYYAYHVVNYRGVPTYRAHAWALLDYELHGGHLLLNSSIRTDKVIHEFNKKYHTDLHSQRYLYEHQGDLGFFPANPPWLSSHCGFSDGNPIYPHGPGARIPKYMIGIDAVQRPGGDAADVVSWLNHHGYHATRPYHTKGERHHFNFTKSPAHNARRRLAKWLATGK